MALRSSDSDSNSATIHLRASGSAFTILESLIVLVVLAIMVMIITALFLRDSTGSSVAEPSTDIPATHGDPTGN